MVSKLYADLYTETGHKTLISKIMSYYLGQKYFLSIYVLLIEMEIIKNLHIILTNYSYSQLIAQ